MQAMAVQQHRATGRQMHRARGDRVENLAARGAIGLGDIYLAGVGATHSCAKGRAHYQVAARPHHQRRVLAVIQRNAQNKPMRFAQKAPLLWAFRQQPVDMCAKPERAKPMRRLAFVGVLLGIARKNHRQLCPVPLRRRRDMGLPWPCQHHTIQAAIGRVWQRIYPHKPCAAMAKCRVWCIAQDHSRARICRLRPGARLLRGRKGAKPLRR